MGLINIHVLVQLAYFRVLHDAFQFRFACVVLNAPIHHVVDHFRVKQFRRLTHVRHVGADVVGVEIANVDPVNVDAALFAPIHFQDQFNKGRFASPRQSGDADDAVLVRVQGQIRVLKQIIARFVFERNFFEPDFAEFERRIVRCGRGGWLDGACASMNFLEMFQDRSRAADKFDEIWHHLHKIKHFLSIQQNHGQERNEKDNADFLGEIKLNQHSAENNDGTNDNQVHSESIDFQMGIEIHGFFDGLVGFVPERIDFAMHLSPVNDFVNVVEDFQQIGFVFHRVRFVFRVFVHHVIALCINVVKQDDVAQYKDAAEHPVMIEEIHGQNSQKSKRRQYVADDVIKEHETNGRYAVDGRTDFGEIGLAQIVVVGEQQQTEYLVAHPLSQFGEEFVLVGFVDIMEGNEYEKQDHKQPIILMGRRAIPGFDGLYDTGCRVRNTRRLNEIDQQRNGYQDENLVFFFVIILEEKIYD